MVSFFQFQMSKNIGFLLNTTLISSKRVPFLYSLLPLMRLRETAQVTVKFIGKIPNLFLKSSLISITQVPYPLPLPLNLLKWGKCIHSQTDTDDVHNISLIWSGDILSFGIDVNQETIINRFLHFSLIRRVKFSVNLQPVKDDTAKT